MGSCCTLAHLCDNTILDTGLHLLVFWMMSCVCSPVSVSIGLAMVLGLAGHVSADWEQAPPSTWRHFFRDRNVGVAFNSLSATQWGTNFTTGAKVALFSKRDQTGPRLVFFSTEKLRESDPLIVGRFNQYAGTRVLGGYEWNLDGLVVSAYGGASLVMHSPWERAVTRYDARLGVAGMLEFWKNWQPGRAIPEGFTAGTLMLDAAERSAYFKVRHGFSTGFHGIAIGPELSVSTGARNVVGRLVARDSWLKTRAGLHATGFRFGQLGINLTAGYEHRNRERGGAYAEATVLWYY
jgi:hypothetical protein